MKAFLLRGLRGAVLFMRRILPDAAFKAVMKTGYGLGRRLLPAGALEDLETTARRSLRMPTPLGGFHLGVSRLSAVDPGAGWVPAPAATGTDGRVPCDLVICCAFQGRHAVLREIVLESLTAAPEVELYWVLTGSTDEDLAFIREIAAETGRVGGFVCANRPLGRKWQSCVRQAYLRFDAALTAITGSDDILPGAFLQRLAAQHREAMAQGLAPSFQPALHGTNNWLVVDIDPASAYGGGIYRCSYRPGQTFQPVGAGRFYSRHALALVEGHLFDSRAARLLDDRGYYEIASRGLHTEYYDLDTGPLVSVKGPWAQMNRMDKLESSRSVRFEDASFDGAARLRRVLSPRMQAFLGLG